MAHLIVGNELDCGINLVVGTMKKCDTFHEVVNKRHDLAVALNIKQDVVAIINKNYKNFDEGATSIMLTYLSTWKSHVSKEATLKNLLSALDSCGLRAISNTIREADFYVKANVTSTHFPSAVPKSYSLTERPIQTENSQINSKEHFAVDEVYVDSWFSSALNKITGKSIITQHDWNSRIVKPHKNLVVSLVKQEQQLQDDSYNLPGIKKGNGFALILNIIRYKSEYRHGAQYDSFMLTQLLIQLGYEVVKYDDCHAFYTKEDVKQIVQLFRDNIKDKKPASVLVFVGGHGKFKDILTSDEKLANLHTTIFYQFDSKECPQLKDVPKIFILQCCRNFDKNDNPGYRNIENAIVCYATLPGCYALRDELSGSPYVEVLVKVIAENAHHNNFIEMLNKTETILKKLPQKVKDEQDFVCLQSTYELLPNFGNFYFKF